MIKRNFLIVLALILSVIPAAHSASIWSATSRAPAVGTERIPVDTSSSSSPGYLSVDAVSTYVNGDLTGVTLSQLQNIATASFLGRITAGSGVVEVLTAANVKTMLALTTSDITEGSNLYFSDERAQDAVGGMVDTTLVYTDGTPLLARAAISGDVVIASGSNTAAIGTGVIVNTDISASAAIGATKLIDGSITDTELGYINTLSSNAQTQLNAKAPLASPTFTGTVTLPAGQVVNGVTLATGGTSTLYLSQDGTYTTPAGGGGGSSAFNDITTGTNTTAAMTVGTGGSLLTSGSGTIAATSAPLSGISGLGTGVGTFLATPSSANLATAVADETGSGALVFGTSPAFTTPNIGTATGSVSGNAGSATVLQTPRTIGGVSFNGSAAIVPQTIQMVDAAADTTTFPLLATSATGSLQPATDAGIAYNASTNVLTSTFSGNITGAVTGNASTATALAANGTNCSAGSFPLGVDASGSSETCTALPTTIAGTANEITASASTGAVTISIPSVLVLSGKTVRIPNSTTLPATCTVADQYMDTDAAGAGLRFFLCTATNTWTAQGADGLGSDGDKGDIIVGGTGTTLTIDTGVIVDADVNAAAAIDATKLANGAVSNTEYQRLDGTVGALYNVGGTDVAVADGGTGASTLTGLLQGNGASAITGITNSSTAGQILRVTGASTYAWGALDLADTDAITNDLPFANLAQGSALSVLGVTGNATADNASIAAGTDHQVLRRSGTALAFGAVNLAQAAAITGILPAANGGAGTVNGVMKANGSGTVSAASAGTDYVAPGTATVYTAQQNFGSQALTDASTITWNAATQQVAHVLLTSGIGATRALGAPSNLVNGGTYILRVTQSATGSNALTYNAVYKWPGGVAPVLSTANNAVDILTFISDGTNMYGVAQKSFQ